MAGEEDFYAVLGLKKECTSEDLRLAYKKLALKWHPDRFFACGDSKYLEEAKMKFQAIQQAYSVLSNADKRFLYDIGVYDNNDDDDENGMCEFLNEMATMMSQTKYNENGNETLEELQQLFDEMFESDIKSSFTCSSRSSTSPTSYSSSSSGETYSNSNKRNSIGTSSAHLRGENMKFDGFCIGKAEGGGRRKNTKRSRK